VYSFLLRREIREESLVPCYFFYGEELFLSHQFIDELRDKLISPDSPDYNINKFNLEDRSWREVLDSARTIPLLFSSKQIIVVEVPKEKQGIISPLDKKLLEDYFSSPPSHTILIIILSGKVRRKVPLFKLFSSFPSSIVFTKELKPLKGKALYFWIDKRLGDKKKTASLEAKRRLVGLIGNNLYLVNNEIEKIITFVDEKKVIEEDDVNQVSGFEKSFLEWEIKDSMETGDCDRLIIMLDRFLKEGTKPGYIISIMTSFFRDILLAKLWLKEREKTRTEIFKELRPQINEKFIRLYNEKFKRFFLLLDEITLKDLNQFLNRLREIDFILKTSNVSAQIFLESFFFDYCRFLQKERIIWKKS